MCITKEDIKRLSENINKKTFVDKFSYNFAR